MQAVQLTEWQHEAELREVSVPRVGPGQVLVKIGGAGACQSDIHIMESSAGVFPWRLPFTLGHENAGWVEKLGSGVGGFSVGDPVAIYGYWGCGYCHSCRSGMENYCENSVTYNSSATGGAGLDGGLADYMLVPSARFLVPLETLAPRDAAALTDAGLTPYHAIKRSIHLLGAGSSAVVIGVGGLGHMAIQILTALTGARILAVDVSSDKLQLARELGANETVVAGQHAAQEIVELGHGRGADLVLDFVGSSETIELGVRASKRQGCIMVVGHAEGSFQWKCFNVPYGCSLVAPFWGSIPELTEVVALAESGGLKCQTTFEPLTRHREVYAALRAGKTRGRTVFVPGPIEPVGETAAG